MNKITTIRVMSATKELLRSFEIYPRETDEQIIIRVLDNIRASKEIGIQGEPSSKKSEASNSKKRSKNGKSKRYT